MLKTLLRKYKNEPFFQFIELVRSKKNPFGELVVLAVERFIKDLENPDLVFDYEEGYRLVKWAKLHHHWRGTKKGEPIILEPHQQFYIIQQFGWFFKDGHRRFRTCYKEVARKNGKTTEEAIKGNWFLAKDGEHGPQIFVGATKEEQAKICVDDCAKFIKGSPALRDKFTIYEQSGIARRVVCPSTSGYIAPLGRDSKRDDGFDPVCGIIDEYHAHEKNEVLDIIESGMGARQNPMIDIITTAGYNKEGPCYRFRKHCIEILRGMKQDETLLVLIFCLDAEDDWTDPKNFVKANPNLGVSVNERFLLTRLKQAMNEGGSKEVDFKTKNLNFWTDSSDVWIPDRVWVKNDGDPNHDDDYWFIGVDLASTRDINAVVCLSDQGSVVPFLFVPEDKIRDGEDKISSYMDWARDGHLIVTPGNTADHEAIKVKIMEFCATHNVMSIDFDRWNAHKMSTELLDEGLPVSYYGQGYKDQNPSCQYLEKSAFEGKFKHGGHPVLRWMCSNVELRRDPAGNIKMDKSASQNKIDGMVALSNAIGGYLTWIEEGVADDSIEVW
jgi:phage terminase large subunit-like protein